MLLVWIVTLILIVAGSLIDIEHIKAAKGLHILGLLWGAQYLGKRCLQAPAYIWPRMNSIPALMVSADTEEPLRSIGDIAGGVIFLVSAIGIIKLDALIASWFV
ncbi:hypothetical protein [Piscinibacterium candidicorallinum]|uniref:Uncharacterized protein n=1 Tax=Piscinibacterium candidicorallinum TaxID=1793872 RepID=A0ABV7H201_9BURK